MKDQAKVSVYDPRNSSLRHKLMNEYFHNDHGLKGMNCDNTLKGNNCDHGLKGNNNCVKTYFAYFLKLLLFTAVIAILISIPWEYMRLYQKARAQKIAQTAQGEPSDCNPENMTLLESFKRLLRYYFSWTHAHSPCEDYYTALLVDPAWEVTPVMVLSSVIAKCVLHPLELLSGSLAQSLRMFFSEIPVQWQPVIMIVAVIIFLMLLLMLFGYRLSIPLLLKLEPKSPRHSLARSQSCPSIADSNDNCIKQKCLSYSGAGSRERCLLPSLSTTSLDNFNNHNLPGEAVFQSTQSFIDARKLISPTLSNTNSLKFSTAGTTASLWGSSKQQSSLLRDGLNQTVARRPNVVSVEHKEERKILQFKQIVTSVVEHKYGNMNAQDKFVAQPKHRTRNVARRKTKETDPLWTPDVEYYLVSDSE